MESSLARSTSRSVWDSIKLPSPPAQNWRVLRRPYATWLVESGADPKAVQGQMRHSRISTTMDIYAQFVPDSQQRAVTQMAEMVAERVAKPKEAGVLVQ